jgi:tRNA pseudouridine38-40 synthase
MFLNQAWRSPLVRQSAWHVAQALDMERMAQASRCLVGTHDFGSFGRPPQGENTVRRVFRVEWDVAQPFVTFEIKATAFLYKMVRSIVGTLAQVGKSRLTVAEFEAILSAKDRCRVKWVAPAHGLCLMSVDYPEGAML